MDIMPPTGPLEGTLISIIRMAGYLVTIASLAAIFAFFWGLAKYIWAAGDEAKSKEGKTIMTWGVVAMFVLISIWGIVGLLQATLGADISAVRSDIWLPRLHY